MRRLLEESRERYRALVGMTVSEARAVVERAGGEFATDDGPIAAKLDVHRVVASVADGRVTRAHIG